MDEPAAFALVSVLAFTPVFALPVLAFTPAFALVSTEASIAKAL
jgi:hypothetical protein